MGKDRRVQLDLRLIRGAQLQWAATPVGARLALLRALRHDIAEHARELAATVPLEKAGQLHRNLADTLCSEVLPLVEACRFLEREAERLLCPVKQKARLRPVWLGSVSVETRREALGIVLIIGPGNYPLFLPGAQALQALAAGNAVLWKPAQGGLNAARGLQESLARSGLDARLLTVLDESHEAAEEAIDARVDKVVLTGSANTGRAVMHLLADTLTPAVMELSGCDAVFVLEGADLGRVVEALVFGLRFNGSATCMAPRRLIVSDSVAARLVPLLVSALRALDPVPAPYSTRVLLNDLVAEATQLGARVVINGLNASLVETGRLGVTIVEQCLPTMRITCTEIFAPVLTLLCANGDDEAHEVHRQCPYALTASVFGPRENAERFAVGVHAGEVLVNDVIVSSADPRASFGGMGMSGFGATRGAAGLLEMTAVKNVVVKRSRGRRAWQPTSAAHIDLFAALLRALHGKGWRCRLAGLRALFTAARKCNS